MSQHITRFGAYGLLVVDTKICTIQLDVVPWEGFFHLPGGGIEFGETPFQALQREWQEEVGYHVKKATLITNHSVVCERGHGLFHNVGMIYQINEYTISEPCSERQPIWIGLNELVTINCSPLLDSLMKQDMFTSFLTKQKDHQHA